jgi:hypothetical protein
MFGIPNALRKGAAKRLFRAHCAPAWMVSGDMQYIWLAHGPEWARRGPIYLTSEGLVVRPDRDAPYRLVTVGRRNVYAVQAMDLDNTSAEICESVLAGLARIIDAHRLAVTL